MPRHTMLIPWPVLVALGLCVTLLPSCNASSGAGENNSGGGNNSGRQPEEYILNPKDASMRLILIPEGEAVFGTENDREPWGEQEGPPFTASLPAYYLGLTEVTNAQYARFLDEADPSEEQLAAWTDLDSEFGSISRDGSRYVVADGRGNHPVVEVTWLGAEAYCNWAGLRLPTELEWEKGARGTDGREYPWGGQGLLDGWDATRCRNATNQPGTPPAGTCNVFEYFEGNSPWGLYCMAGNVWEWTADWFDESVYAQYATGDLTPPANGDCRVIRGGAWNQANTSVFRCAHRNCYSPGGRYHYVGFRCASDP